MEEPFRVGAKGDFWCGSGNSHIATLVERHSRFVMLIMVPSRDTAEVVGAWSTHVRKSPRHPATSPTWDRGLETAKHKDFTVATDVRRSTSAIRRVHGNAARTRIPISLLRNGFPARNRSVFYHAKGSPDQVELRLNQRSRKTLGIPDCR